MSAIGTAAHATSTLTSGLRGLVVAGCSRRSRDVPHGQVRTLWYQSTVTGEWRRSLNDLTDKAKMVLTPTYHVFRMYVPFQNATFVPVAFDAGTYTHGDVTLPRIDAVAAKDGAGVLWLAVTNIDPTRPAELSARLSGITPKTVSGETLTAAAVDSVNSFEAPRTVAPKPVSATLVGDGLTVTLEPKSVTVLTIRR